MQTHIHPARMRFVTRLSPRFAVMVSRLNVRAPAGDRQVPRAPLHAVGVTHRAVTSSVTSEDVTPPSSLIRTHASNQIPLHDSSSPCRRVFAGCRQPLLGDGPSRCYLCNPCLGAWTRTPLRFSGASVRFFPENVGLTPLRRVTTRQNDGRYATLTTQRFRGCSHSLMFRLPRLQRPPDCAHRSGSISHLFPFGAIPEGNWAPIHHAELERLPGTSSGIATSLNRTIDSAGLAPAGLQPYRLLPQRPLRLKIFALMLEYVLIDRA